MKNDPPQFGLLPQWVRNLIKKVRRQFFPSCLTTYHRCLALALGLYHYGSAVCDHYNCRIYINGFPAWRKANHRLS